MLYLGEENSEFPSHQNNKKQNQNNNNNKNNNYQPW